jgi:predicted permease
MRFEHWLYVLPLKWKSLARRGEVDRDLDDEIRYHLETQVEALVAKGMASDDAWRRVRREFGGIAQSKERCRDARGLDGLDALAQDSRYAVRMLWRYPGFTGVAVLTLALGIGVNAAAFSLVDGILLSRLPYAAPDALISVTGTYPNAGLAAMRDEVRTIDVAAYAEGKWFTLKGGAGPIRVAGARVSAELMPILGVEPALGRWLQPGDDVVPRDRHVILSDALWAARFGRDPGIVGRFVELDGVRREVVAVMPASFQFPSARTEVWVPLALDSRNTSSYWAGDYMPIVGRLRDGASIEEAHAEVRLFQSRIVSRFPWTMPADWNQDITVIPLGDAVVGDVRTRLLILMAAVALVMVIACANVANLNLSKAAARQREIAIRAAVGASPRRIARQLLTESVVLAVLGGAAGLFVAGEALAVLKLVLPPDTPRLSDVQLSWRAVLFTGGISILTGCGFGLTPVLSALRLRLRNILDSGGRGSGPVLAGRVRAVLTVAQVACAVLLVIAAGLLMRSLWMLSRADPGFRAGQVVTARISAAEAVCSVPERCLAFSHAVWDQAQAAAGVSGAALVNTLPLTGVVAKRSFDLEGFSVPTSENAPLFWLHVITPGYFQVMGIPVESGRPFTREDLTGPPVAIVTSATARQYWNGQNPIGRRVRFVGEKQWHTIVGVVADVRAYTLTKRVPDWMDGTVYVPNSRYGTMEDGRVPADMTLTLRTTLDRGHVESLVRRLVEGVSGEAVVGEIRPMHAVLAAAVEAPAATTSLVATMAGLALVLGCVGVYGLLSFFVSRQTRDLGIRFALGARRRDVLWLVVREGVVMSTTGIAIGIAAAMVLTRSLSSELYGVSPTDPVTYAAVAGAIFLVTLMACYVPTRRAMNVDPLIVLREE